jgi:hypothetical protein
MPNPYSIVRNIPAKRRIYGNIIKVIDVTKTAIKTNNNIENPLIFFKNIERIRKKSQDFFNHVQLILKLIY